MTCHALTGLGLFAAYGGFGLYASIQMMTHALGGKPTGTAQVDATSYDATGRRWLRRVKIWAWGLIPVGLGSVFLGGAICRTGL